MAWALPVSSCVSGHCRYATALHGRYRGQIFCQHQRSSDSDELLSGETVRALLTHSDNDPLHPGVFIEHVLAESPAAYAGIQPHDVVIRFNAQEVPDPQTLLRLVRATAIGTIVDVDIIRDGQRRTIRVVVEKRPAPRS